MKTLRKLVLGETWILPCGVALALAVAGLVPLVAGPDGWWRSVGGWLLFVLLAAVLGVAVRR
jgi:hypothetical protein